MSTIIKAGTAGPLLRTLTTVDLADHFAEAREVLQRARQEAVRILEAANREAAVRMAATNRDLDRAKVVSREEAKKEGYAAGYEAGRQAGFDASFKESQERFAIEQASVVAVLVQAAGAIDAMKADVVMSAERDLLDFVLTAVSKMTYAVGRQCRESVIENFKRSIRLVADQSGLCIRVHPQDAESLSKFTAETLEALKQSPAVRIETDDTMSPGGCVVEGRHISVDASLETQVQELTRMLLGEPSDRG